MATLRIGQALRVARVTGHWAIRIRIHRSTESVHLEQVRMPVRIQTMEVMITRRKMCVRVLHVN